MKLRSYFWPESVSAQLCHSTSTSVSLSYRSSQVPSRGGHKNSGGDLEWKSHSTKCTTLSNPTQQSCVSGDSKGWLEREVLRVYKMAHVFNQLGRNTQHQAQGGATIGKIRAGDKGELHFKIAF